MVKKKKTVTKPKKEEQKVRGFVNYTVFENHSAAVECHCTDKEMVALILILYKRLDADARKVIDAVIRTLSLIDKV